MPFDAVIAERIANMVKRRKGFTQKKMFGGVAFLFQAKMCIGLSHDTLIARVGPEMYKTLLKQPFVREFDFTGKPMKGWVMVEPEGYRDDEALRFWIETASQFVKTLPPK
jgi:TfoX/Sxy family transcriptional regulator of competence genes